MTLNEYQDLAARTAVYPKDLGFFYTALGLAGEAGEYANKVKKVIRRDDKLDPKEYAKELGDCLWYIALAAKEIGFTLDEIATMNVAKLYLRDQAGTLKGSGDER